MPRLLPQQASCIEEHFLYRMHVRLLRGDINHPLKISPPCIIVAGLGAVEVSSSSASTRLTRPEPLARLGLDALRRRMQLTTATMLLAPCVVPNSLLWHKEENAAATSLAHTLDRAYRKDPPDWLLMPSYLPGSVPGVIVARRQRREQRWIFLSATALEDWVQQECELERHPDQDDEDFSSAARDPSTLEEHEPDRRPEEGEDDPSSEAKDQFVSGDYVVSLKLKYFKDAARKIVEGTDYCPPKRKRTKDGKEEDDAKSGAWRRVACIYALNMQKGMPECQDLRERGWTNAMAKAVENWVDALRPDTRGWLSKGDGPRIFAQKLTVRRRDGTPASDATDALVELIDTLVRPHGRTRTGSPH
ncbi:hypothetical protein WME77_19325 [Sorangium sp. So ce764]|uniref:hypothetical protein n=1 Tax=Sorangium sp. So ce764 TaxID=3133320 RepID=UPI003F5DABB3